MTVFLYLNLQKEVVSQCGKFQNSPLPEDRLGYIVIHLFLLSESDEDVLFLLFQFFENQGFQFFCQFGIVLNSLFGSIPPLG